MPNTLLQNLYERFYMLVDLKMQVERQETGLLNSKNEPSSYADIINYINNINNSIDTVRSQIKIELKRK